MNGQRAHIAPSLPILWNPNADVANEHLSRIPRMFADEVCLVVECLNVLLFSVRIAGHEKHLDAFPSILNVAGECKAAVVTRIPDLDIKNGAVWRRRHGVSDSAGDVI